MNPQLDIQNPIEDEAGAKRGQGKLALVLGGLVLVLALAGAAFVAGRYITQKRPAGSSQGPMLQGMAGPGGGGRAFSVEIEPAKELPDSEPDVSGIFTRREDNSIFLGTGKATFAVTKDGASSSYDGPVVEVMVTNDTTVYRDDTLGSGEPPTSGTVQQKVIPGSSDEIGENSMVTVWGKKSGDRVIAEVLVYSQPMVMARPGN